MVYQSKGKWFYDQVGPFEKEEEAIRYVIEEVKREKKRKIRFTIPKRGKRFYK